MAILRYRLFDIDRIISRTLASAIVTGLLVGMYAGLVLLATRMLSIRSPVAVAAATLAAAALFNPVRHRAQRVVDQRFNRARYDADTAVAAFAARLQDAVDLDAVSDNLARVITSSPGTRPPVRVAQQSLFRTTNPVRIICAGQLLVRVFAARVVAAHNGPARSLWRPSLNPRPLTPSISIMGCGVVREYWLQFICNRGVNSGRLQFTPTRAVC